MKLRRSPRLKHFDYIGPFTYSLTLVIRRRTRLLNNQESLQTVLECLARSCTEFGFTAHAYCLMPDHLHLLVSGQSTSSLKDSVRHFKQLSGYTFKARHGIPLWQISYYDHVLRKDEDLSTIARYIWDNPVRAGLANTRTDYPYSGPRPLPED